jgi:hypothetical protein
MFVLEISALEGTSVVQLVLKPADNELVCT